MKDNIKFLILGFVLFSCFACIGPAYALGDMIESSGGQPLVSSTFFDSDLRESLKEISLQCKVNIIADDNVRGIITMDLKNVPLEKALRMMLIGGGYSYRKVDDFYVVGLPDPKNPAFAALCESAVYDFQNIGAESARALLPAFYDSFVRIDAAKGSAVIVAPPDLLQKILDDLKKMDGLPNQFKIKALVTEITNEALKEVGVNLLNFDFTKSDWNLKSTAIDVPNGLLTLTFGSLAATIQALANEKKATIHADPELVVTEGKSGDLWVGEKRTLILYSQGTNAITSSTENVEAGTYLKVTPKNIGELIELTICQKTSNFDDETSDKITVQSREFNSVVRIKPGQSVLVAGLTQKQTKNKTLKTPGLADIPIIGLLFKQKSTFKGDTQLLVFLTAEVLKK